MVTGTDVGDVAANRLDNARALVPEYDPAEPVPRKLIGRWPSMECRSLWHTPVATVRTRTS
jgi:hypothetical protein